MIYRFVGNKFGTAHTLLRATVQGSIANALCGLPLNTVLFIWGPWMEHFLTGTPDDPGVVTSQKLKNDLVHTTVMSAAVWIPATAINFRFCPIRYRMIVASVVSVGWGCYTSIVVHS